jgi:hypothetical protein
MRHVERFSDMQADPRNPAKALSASVVEDTCRANFWKKKFQKIGLANRHKLTGMSTPTGIGSR